MPVSASTCRTYGSGTSTSATGEACTLSSGNTVAQVTNTAKRIVDPEAAFTLYDNGVAQAASTYTLNGLYAKATKVSGSWTGPVTMDLSYLPQLELDESYSADIELARDAIDTTVFKSDNHRTCILGLGEANLALAMLSDPNRDFDPGAGTLKLETVLSSGGTIVTEVTFPDGTLSFRMLCTLPSLKLSSQVAGRYEVSTQMKSTRSGSVSVRAFAFSDE